VTVDTGPAPVLAEFFDALGRRVTAEPTRSGLLAILTRTPEETGLRGGHPALNAENAAELRDALDKYLEGQS
jgi:hypothetical protein